MRIQGIGGGTPTIRGDLIGGQAFGLVSNESEPADGITSQLVIDFARPVRQVGFLLRHESPNPTTVNFLFRNLRGTNLGVLQTQIEQGIGPFAGFEAPQGEVFSKVLISYGDSPSPEQFLNLLFTYADRPTYQVYVPQVGDGALPGGGGLRTNILIANLTSTTASGQLLLFGDDGQPLELDLSGTTASEFELNLPARSLQVFETSAASSPPVQGYACVETDHPVSATGIFQILNASGRPLSEAGVEATEARHQAVATVIREAGVSLNSGIAVANASDQPANGVVQLLDSNGTLVASNSDFAQLGPRAHAAGFLPQLFPGVAADFEGTLLIFSDQPLAVVVLRTVQGLVQSSLPVGGLGR